MFDFDRHNLDSWSRVEWLVCGFLLALVVLLVPQTVIAQEIVDPASEDLPPELLDPMPPEMLNQGGDVGMPGGGFQDDTIPDGGVGPEGLDPDPNLTNPDASMDQLDEIDATWENYTDLGGMSGVAEEVTGGVRVEDIIEPPSEYRYAAFGKPDPFVAPLTLRRGQTAGENTVDSLEIPIVSPLQRFRLNELRLVGLWQRSSGEKRGLIITPESEGIIIKVSDPIGRRGGKVLAIGAEDVTVREFTLDPDGTRQYEDRQMFMGRPDIDELPGKIVFTPGEGDPEVDIEGMPEGETRNPLAPNAGTGDIPAGAVPGQMMENGQPAMQAPQGAAGQAAPVPGQQQPAPQAAQAPAAPAPAAATSQMPGGITGHFPAEAAAAGGYDMGAPPEQVPEESGITNPAARR